MPIKTKRKQKERCLLMYALQKLILVLLKLPPRPSGVLLSLQLGAVGGANSSQLCVSLRGHRDRSVTGQNKPGGRPVHAHHNMATLT